MLSSLRPRALSRPLSNSKRRRHAVVAVLAVAAALLAAPLSASASTANPGYVLESSALIGDTPLTMQVYMDPAAHDRAAIGTRLAAAAHDLTYYGLHVHYAGYGKHAIADGVIQVTENTSACQVTSTYTRLGVTKPYVYHLVNGSIVNVAASIVFCPTAFSAKASTWSKDEIVRHEMGHAVGLDHMNTTYGGKYQTMRYIVTSTSAKYQSGDVNGIRHLASGASKVRSLLYPTTHLDSVKRSSRSSVLLTGWGFLSGSVGTQIYYQISEGGKVLGYVYNKVTRADVNSHYHISGVHGLSWNIPSDANAHTYCLKALVSTGYAENVNLGCHTVAKA